MKGSIISLVFGFVIMIMLLLISAVVFHDQKPKASLYSEANFEESRFKSVAVTGAFLQDEDIRERIGLTGLSGYDYRAAIESDFEEEVVSEEMGEYQLTVSNTDVEVTEGLPEGFTQVYVASPSEELRVVTVGAE